jgi:hypothetical protein
VRINPGRAGHTTAVPSDRRIPACTPQLRSHGTRAPTVTTGEDPLRSS